MTADADQQPDAIWQAVDIVCDTPTLLLLESIWLGSRRFDEFQRITGLMKAVVSARLKKLITAKILKKRLYCERPARYEYVLDQKGLALFPVALMMLRWEKKWNSGKDHISVNLCHTSCGQIVSPVCQCQSCQQEITAHDIERTVAINANLGAASYVKRRRQAGMGSIREGQTKLFAEIAEIFGDRWSTLIVRAAFLGATKFDTFLKDLQVSTNILTSRLQWLVEKGLLSRIVYQQSPKRFEYRLTEKALDLYPILLFLLQWGQACFGGDSEPSVTLRHKQCNQPLKAVATCSACGEILSIENLSLAD